MPIRHLSKGDAICLLEMISESLACDSTTQVKALMGRLTELLPYQAGLACIAKLGASGAVEELKVVNLDYPEEYLAVLGQQGLVMKDPIVLENFRSFRLQYWADTMGQSAFTPDTHNLLSLAEDYGFRKARRGVGYGHGVKNHGGTVGSFFCYHGLARSGRTEEILSLVIPHFHEALRRVEKVAAPSGATLTGKEIEILQWLKQGKSSWDISAIIGISERTVKFHVANIMRKLDAVSRTHAVARAMELGLLAVD